VDRQTPTSPVNLACAQAASAATSSCATCDTPHTGVVGARRQRLRRLPSAARSIPRTWHVTPTSVTRQRD
jgi:ribosomal protein L34E